MKNKYNIKLKIVPENQKDVLLPMFQEYLIELSKYIENIKFNELGKPIYNWYDHYWKDSGRTPYFAMVNEKPVGFALIRTLNENTVEIAEFSIFSEFRNQHLGKDFAKLLIEKYNCNVEFSVGVKNLPALAFWENFSKNYSNCKTKIVDGFKYYYIIKNNINN